MNPTLWAALFLAGAGLGGTLVHELDTFRYDQLTHAVDLQNTQAAAQLAVARSQVALSESKAKVLNDNLESSRVSAITTINTYHQQLSSISVCPQSAGRARGDDAVSIRPATPQFQEALINFLKPNYTRQTK